MERSSGSGRSKKEASRSSLTQSGTCPLSHALLDEVERPDPLVFGNRFGTNSKILKKIAAITFNSANEIVFGDKLGDAYTCVASSRRDRSLVRRTQR